MELLDNLRQEREIALDFWRQAKKQKTSPDYFKGKIDELALCIHQLELSDGKDSEREQANDNIPLVNNRTFIVTIECGEDTADWKIAAPNELAAKITASANYSGKRFNILRCVEYGC